MAFQSCGKDVELVSGCPADTEQLLFINTGSSTGMSLRTWGAVKNCLLASTFGTGILTINGTQLDSEGIYLNSDLINDLVIFYNGISRFLNHGTEWGYELNVDNQVVGIQILGGGVYTVDDVFLIFPNPKSS